MADDGANLQQIEVDLHAGLGDHVVEVALAILSAVVIRTPVGDPTLWENPNAKPPGYTGGSARGGWAVGVGGDPDAPERVDKTGAVTISHGRQALEGYNLGPQVIIMNVQPHIVPLNNGHSTQAPAGFIEAAALVATEAAAAERGLI